jgi:putrescine transport system ATP-binding protein
MQREIGIAFVVVTHDHEEALVMSDRIAVLDRGRISQLGAPTDLYEHPRNRFTARFLGHMNLIEGRIENGRFVAAGIGPLAGTLAEAAADGPGCLAVRPERLRLAAPGEGLSGAVAEIAYHGVGQSIHLKLPGGTLLRVDRRPADVDALPLNIGDTAVAIFDPAHARILAGGPAE